MKKYKVRYLLEVEFEIPAESKKKAEEYADFLYDQSQPHEPEVEVTVIQ